MKLSIIEIKTQVTDLITSTLTLESIIVQVEILLVNNSEVKKVQCFYDEKNKSFEGFNFGYTLDEHKKESNYPIIERFYITNEINNYFKSSNRWIGWAKKDFINHIGDCIY